MLLSITYIIGITAEAMTAALAAGRQRFDLFGVLVLACVTAFGGGVVRDLLLDHYPLIWVENPVYLIIVLVAAMVTVSLSFLAKYFSTVFLVADAVGLCAFSVLGTRIALELGHGFLIATVASVATGVFGGVLRDLFSDRIPLVFQKDLYASISVGITVVYLGLDWVGLEENWIILLTLSLGIAGRLAALHWNISLPVFESLGEEQQMAPRLYRGLRGAYRVTGVRRARLALRRRGVHPPKRPRPPKFLRRRRPGGSGPGTKGAPGAE